MKVLLFLGVPILRHFTVIPKFSRYCKFCLDSLLPENTYKFISIVCKSCLSNNSIPKENLKIFRQGKIIFSLNSKIHFINNTLYTEYNLARDSPIVA